MLPLILALLGALFLLAPILIVVPMSFSTAISFAFPPPGYWLGYYRKFFTSEEWLEPVFNSLVIAVGAMLFTMLLVLPAAFGYVRYRFRGKTLVNLLIMSPLIVPHVVSALAYYGFLGRAKLTGTHVGVIIAHGVLAVHQVPQEAVALGQLQVLPGARVAQHKAEVVRLRSHLLQRPPAAAARFVVHRARRGGARGGCMPSPSPRGRRATRSSVGRRGRESRRRPQSPRPLTTARGH